jgi:hypothetical protein
VYSSFKQRTKAFFNNITSNPLNRSERFRRSMLCWELFIKLFMLVLQPPKEVGLSCHVPLSYKNRARKEVTRKKTGSFYLVLHVYVLLKASAQELYNHGL